MLNGLPRSLSGLAWHLAFAVQAGMSLGLLLLFAPILMGRLTGTIQVLANRVAGSGRIYPAPLDLHFSLPVIRLPHHPIPRLPIVISHANLPIWLILGIAALLLFAVGNFRLIFHNTSEPQK